MSAASQATGKENARAARRAVIPVLLWFGAACVSALAIAPPSRAQAYNITLDPASTKIEFTLDTTLHTVHGTFQLKSGQIHFDAATGKATGAIVVDARSGDTGNSSRDKKMHQQILESQKFPEITFTPQQVQGAFHPEAASQLQISGTFQLHGQTHPLTAAISVQPSSATQLQSAVHFTIPYKDWGLKDPSTFLLRASDTVVLEIDALTRITPDQAAH
ncbi:MAG: YceI family protein [Candidatus Acidiferrales bacterium]